MFNASSSSTRKRMKALSFTFFSASHSSFLQKWFKNKYTRHIPSFSMYQLLSFCNSLSVLLSREVFTKIKIERLMVSEYTSTQYLTVNTNQVNTKVSLTRTKCPMANAKDFCTTLLRSVRPMSKALMSLPVGKREHIIIYTSPILVLYWDKGWTGLQGLTFNYWSLLHRTSSKPRLPFSSALLSLTNSGSPRFEKGIFLWRCWKQNIGISTSKVDVLPWIYGPSFPVLFSLFTSYFAPETCKFLPWKSNSLGHSKPSE